jgi:hypothetical protein
MKNKIFSLCCKDLLATIHFQLFGEDFSPCNLKVSLQALCLESSLLLFCVLPWLFIDVQINLHSQ